MSNRADIPSRLLVDGKPLLVTLISNPTIDDVLIGEARVEATAIESRDLTVLDSRRVPRNIRDYLIRQGVQQ
jgi:hypothetical protein